MRTALAVVLVVAALSGCGKKSSKEYFEARRAYDQLVDRDGEDAYLTPEMMQVSNALAAVPERAIEYPQAQQLVAKIASEKARVEHEKAELATALEPKPLEKIVPATPRQPPPNEGRPEAGGPAAPGDDGPPTGGMLEAAFQAKFGSCVTGPEQLTVEGAGAVPAYVASSNPVCLKRLGLTEPSKFFFIKGALAGRQTTSTTTTRVILDGGVVATPGAISRTVTGQPVVGAPPGPPDQGSLAPAGTGEGMKANGTASDFGARKTP